MEIGSGDNRYGILYVEWVEPSRSSIGKSGCSLHLTEEDFKAFEESYTKNCDGDIVNFRTAGTPREAYVNNSLYGLVQKGENGLRLYRLQTERALEGGSLILNLEEALKKSCLVVEKKEI